MSTVSQQRIDWESGDPIFTVNGLWKLVEITKRFVGHPLEITALMRHVETGEEEQMTFTQFGKYYADPKQYQVDSSAKGLDLVQRNYSTQNDSPAKDIGSKLRDIQEALQGAHGDNVQIKAAGVVDQMHRLLFS